MQRSTVVYIDVDDTFVRSFGSKRIPMSASVQLIRDLKNAGATLYCWSSGGGEYAKAAAIECGIADCFAGFLPKPQVLIDDVLFSNWKVQEAHPNEAASLTALELLNPSKRF